MRKIVSVILVFALIMTSSLSCFASEGNETFVAQNGDQIFLVSATENVNIDGSITKVVKYSINGVVTNHNITTNLDGSSVIKIDGEDDFTINISDEGYATSDNAMFNDKYLFKSNNLEESSPIEDAASVSYDSNWRYLYYEAKSLDYDNIISSAIISGVTGKLITTAVSIMLVSFPTKYQLTKLGSMLTRLISSFLSGVVSYYASGTYTSCTMYVYEFVMDTNIRKAEMSLYYRSNLIAEDLDVYNVEGWD